MSKTNGRNKKVTVREFDTICDCCGKDVHHNERNWSSRDRVEVFAMRGYDYGVDGYESDRDSVPSETGRMDICGPCWREHFRDLMKFRTTQMEIDSG